MIRLSGIRKPSVERDDVCHDDPNGGETGRALARHLTDSGWPSMRAWAFVWRCTGAEWHEVADLIRDQFGTEVTVARLRQWGVRYFDPNLPQARTFLRGLKDGIPSDRVFLCLFLRSFWAGHAYGMPFGSAH